MSKMALGSVVVSLAPEMALHPALDTVNQWALKRASMAKCWNHPKLCNERRRSQNKMVMSVVSNVEDGTRISGGQLGTRDGSAPCTQHGEPVGTQESVDGEMLGPSKAM